MLDPNMRFDAEGRCHYYHEYREVEKRYLRKGEDGHRLLDALVERIRNRLGFDLATLVVNWMNFGTFSSPTCGRRWLILR